MAAKRSKFSKTKRVKAIARKRVGTPPPSRVLEERTIRGKPKHKQPWTEEQAD